jgi:hypothetical protein
VLIRNKTSLEYATIGMIIDQIQKSNTGNTMYYGKVDWTILEVGSHKIKVQIRYLKRYVEWYFTELGE